jgi:hypothetical protein
MRERKSAVVISVAFCCLLSALAVVGLTKPSLAEGKDELYGKWKNELYSNETYLYVYESNGEASCYAKWSDQPVYKGRFLIEKEWKDEQGNTYYKVIEIWSRSSFYKSGEFYNRAGPGQWRYFKIHKLNATGEVLETVGSKKEYPKEFSRSPVDGFYQIHYRQK